MAQKIFTDESLSTFVDEIKGYTDSAVSGKANSSHNHAASNITSGTLSSDRLPTVPITKGGTGATTAAAALTNLGLTATAAELNKMDGVTATTTELNYVDGVTSNIQTQLDGKAASSHTHSYAGSSSAGGAATSANKLNTDAGGTTQPVYFANGVPVKTTYTLGKSVPSDAKFTDTTYSAATTSANGLMSSTDKTKLDATNIAYGTCSTAAATAAKVITVSGNTNWKLAAGSIITILFSATNTAKNPTFNVNGTGAKNVFYEASQITTSSLGYAGTASRPMNFMYDGTQYIFIGWGYDSNTTYTNVKLGHGYATCSTAEATTAKVASLSSYTLTTGGIVAVKFTNAVPASATLNINSKGAKNIYYRGAKITAGVIKAGDVATFIYSSQYHLISIDRWQQDITNIQTALDGKSDSSHTHSAATTSANGFMTSAMVTKLNGIATGANAYTHPSYTARTGKPTANQTPAFGGTATVSQITSDASGHVTGATDRTITIPSTLSNGSGTAGLIKTSSTVTSNSGYTACPVISGVPYYKNNTYTSLKNPYSLTIQGNGTTLTNGTYNGSAAKTVNITPSAIGALALTGGTLSGNLTVSKTDTSDTSVKVSNSNGGVALHAQSNRGLFDITANKWMVRNGGSGVAFDQDVSLMSSTPTISFHYNAASSATAQIVADTDSRLKITSALRVEGGFAPQENIYVNNTKFMYWNDSSNTSISIMGVGNDNIYYTGNNSYNTVLRGKSVKLGSTSGSAVTSDRNLKTNIEDVDAKYMDFFSKLRPVIYKYELGNSQRNHIGFIAQEVEEALNDSGLTNKEFGGICVDSVTYCEQNKDDLYDDMIYAHNKGLDKVYSLRYEEFIALNTRMIQSLQSENKELKEKLSDLEEKLNNLVNN